MMFNNKDIYLGVVYDAMRLLGYRAQQFYLDIKPLGGYTKLISGPAFTTYGEIVSKDIDYDELDRIRLNMYRKDFFSEKPIVLLQANDDYCAHSGDITSQIYQKLGAVGFVTDGNVRDIDRIDALKFPTFAKSANPIDAIDYWALTKFQIPIAVENVTIHPGDYIFASLDGVIVVPQKELSNFYDELEKILSKENKARQFIDSLDNMTDAQQGFNDFVDQYGRW